MADKPYRDPGTLRELYHGEGLTTREVADELDCSHTTIIKYFDEFDIDTRPNWKAGVEAAVEANRREYVTLRTLDGGGYEYWASKEGSDRTTRIVYVHRLLAVAEYGYDSVRGMDVHHRNNIPWDNRPGNIELMDKAEHTRRHNLGEIGGGSVAR